MFQHHLELIHYRGVKHLAASNKKIVLIIEFKENVLNRKNGAVALK